MLSSPAAILRRMARRRRTQPPEEAGPAFLEALLASDHPDHALLEAGHALVDALDRMGRLDRDAKHWHADLSAKRTLACTAQTATAAPSMDAGNADVVTLDISTRKAMFESMVAKIAAGTLSTEDAVRTRMMAMGLEASGVIDSQTADAVLRDVAAITGASGPG